MNTASLKILRPFRFSPSSVFQSLSNNFSPLFLSQQIAFSLSGGHLQRISSRSGDVPLFVVSMVMSISTLFLSVFSVSERVKPRTLRHSQYLLSVTRVMSISSLISHQWYSIRTTSCTFDCDGRCRRHCQRRVDRRRPSRSQHVDCRCCTDIGREREPILIAKGVGCGEDRIVGDVHGDVH